MIGVALVGNLFVVDVPEGRQDAGQAVRRWTASCVREVELPGIGTAGGFGGKRTDTETFYSFSSFATPPSIYPLRPDHRREHAAAPGRGRLRSRRVRNQAGLLHQQGRHAGADVHHPQEGAEARRQQPDAALRLRRVQHPADARLLDQPGRAGWRWAASSPSPTCAAAASTARSGTRPARSSRSRTCSTTSSPRPSG